MKHFTQQTTLMGTVEKIDLDSGSLLLRCRSGDEFTVFVGAETQYQVLRNLDGVTRDRVADSGEVPEQSPYAGQIRKYVRKGEFLVVQGTYQEYENQRRLDCRQLYLLHSVENAYLFEDTHWWLNQISIMADEWLEDLFDTARSYTIDDFAALYRTNLNILGGETDDNVQECATLSRLIYGLSSAYLLTGAERYYLAARAGVEYQRQAFRSLTHDGKHCIWAYGRRKLPNGSLLLMESSNPDDRGSVPLYEQIYALAGLTQFYRITQDWETLEDIRRTVNMINAFYLDDEKARKEKDFSGLGGYYSHLDYATMRPDSPALGKNQSRKNWNSIGDHIPAYLVNLLLALDPLPTGRDREELSELLSTCRRMLVDTTDLIMEKFPDPELPYVNERFFADWRVDHEWGWQRNRAIVGHNLKIAWNLTRCANYFLCLERDLSEKDPEQARAYRERAEHAMKVADKLARDMAKFGVDAVRSGVFDAVERRPGNNMPIDFSWGSTKDFWQQEQGILAYLILYGATEDRFFLEMARETAAFWNLFFLDHENRGIYFRVTDCGMPIVKGEYGRKGGHSISAYHAFELNYLAHLYTRAYVRPTDKRDATFCLYFKPAENSGRTSINVLPDFFKPGDLKVVGLRVNGEARANFTPDSFQVELQPQPISRNVTVEFCPCAPTLNETRRDR